MAQITINTLLKAGVHFGHQTRRWCPKMKPYIFGERNGIYILDLKRTIIEADKAYSFLAETAAKGGEILFVGTKKQAQEAIATEAKRAGQPYVTNRWLGGMLTNFVTMRSRVARMQELEAMVEDGRMAALPKKEQAVLGKELAKLQANLDGIRDMTTLPKALFVVDTPREKIAIRSISIMTSIMADAILAGKGTTEITAEEMAAPAEAAEPAAEEKKALTLDEVLAQA